MWYKEILQRASPIHELIKDPAAQDYNKSAAITREGGVAKSVSHAGFGSDFWPTYTRQSQHSSQVKPREQSSSTWVVVGVFPTACRERRTPFLPFRTTDNSILSSSHLADQRSETLPPISARHIFFPRCSATWIAILSNCKKMKVADLFDPLNRFSRHRDQRKNCPCEASDFFAEKQCRRWNFAAVGSTI
ncbi:hypothetical protein K0M31_019042 [Melipona bicolor]|uniref:Uncharacterized protein n=1 Tax=Melipona bicolor TaxID=60889 RepID=A0AA40FCH7_9HYME|nr:hypothetical protein K0M31_019042 [Melipona bicolor]